MVDGDGNLVAGSLSAFGHVVLQIIKPLLRDVDAGEGVRGVEQVVSLAAHGPRVDGAVGRREDGLLVFPHLLQKAARCGERAGDIHQELDAQIHLEEGKALRHARLESLAHVASAGLGVGVAVDADPVAELAAQELPDGDAPGLARDVPERDFDARDAAALPRHAAELLDAPENLLHVAGVFAEDAALEHGRVSPAGGIADFAVAHNALVGVDLDQRAAFRRAVDVGKTHVGDFKTSGVAVSWLHVGYYSLGFALLARQDTLLHPPVASQ